MKYNTLSDHDDVFEIPELLITDKPLWLGITSLGVEYSREDRESRERFAYSFATGPYDADVQWQGDDVRGPAIGSVSAAEIAATLLGFGSAYGEGHLETAIAHEPGEIDTLNLVYDGDVVATGETAQFLSDNAERFGMASSELDNEYIKYEGPYWNETLDQPVWRPVQTGKEDE